MSGTAGESGTMRYAAREVWALSQPRPGWRRLSSNWRSRVWIVPRSPFSVCTRRGQAESTRSIARPKRSRMTRQRDRPPLSHRSREPRGRLLQFCCLWGLVACVGRGGGRPRPGRRDRGHHRGGGALLVRAVARHHAETIQSQLAHGGLVLWVSTPDEAAEQRALEVLRRCGGTSVHTHSVAQEWGVADSPLHDVQPDPFLERDT
jgi:hypothetical protein